MHIPASAFTSLTPSCPYHTIPRTRRKIYLDRLIGGSVVEVLDTAVHLGHCCLLLSFCHADSSSVAQVDG